MPDRFQLNRGSILIESLVALSIIVTSFSAALYLVTSSFGLNRVVSDQYTGAQLAAEGIEIVKNIIDGNVMRCLPWNSGFTNGVFIADYNDFTLSALSGNQPLRFDSSSGVYGYDSGAASRFNRVIKIEVLSANNLRVNSTADWITRGGVAFSASVEDYFYNWRTDINIPPQCR